MDPCSIWKPLVKWMTCSSFNSTCGVGKHFVQLPFVRQGSFSQEHVLKFKTNCQI